MSQSSKRPSAQEARPARRGWPRAVGEDALAEAAPAMARAGFIDPTLVLRWPEIVGPGVARVAEPLKWQEGPEGATLTLRCEAGAAVFLQHETRPLLERLNGFFGRPRIARIRLVPGTLTVRPEAPSNHRNHETASDDPQDSSLASALERLAKRRSRRAD